MKAVITRQTSFAMKYIVGWDKFFENMFVTHAFEKSGRLVFNAK
jgi:hypothetical protein